MIRDEDIVVADEPDLTGSERLYFPILTGMRTTFRHMFKKKITVQYPEVKRTLRVENYRGVHRLNRDDDGRVSCVACFMCETACPAHCIHIVAGESPWPDREKYPVQFDIDELRCIYCGMCEEACPVDAIELTPEYDHVGRTREEMIYDKEKLLAMFDRTKDVKPRKNPKITGYPHHTEEPLPDGRGSERPLADGRGLEEPLPSGSRLVHAPVLVAFTPQGRGSDKSFPHNEKEAH